MANCLAIIPARSGSKRLPRKNIRKFLNIPIIKYSIDAALQSKCFVEVMVSTDSLEISRLALSLGAKVPFLRSQSNSSDYATTAEVIYEVLNEYNRLGVSFDYCCCIYPTVPFISSENLFKAYEKLKNSNAFSIVSVVKYNHPVERSLRLENDLLVMNYPEYKNTRTQDLPFAFHDAAQFYIVKVGEFLKTKEIFSIHTLSYELPETEVQDINYEEDWLYAEIKYKLKSLHSS